MFQCIVDKSDIKAQHFVSFPARADEKAPDPHADLLLTDSGTHQAFSSALGSVINNIASLGLIGAPRAQACGIVNILHIKIVLPYSINHTVLSVCSQGMVKHEENCFIYSYCYL